MATPIRGRRHGGTSGWASRAGHAIRRTPVLVTLTALWIVYCVTAWQPGSGTGQGGSSEGGLAFALGTPFRGFGERGRRGLRGFGLVSPEESLTPLPDFDGKCPGAEEAFRSSDDLSLWKPEGEWNVSGPKHRVALFTGAYDHIRDGVALTLNRLVAFLELQGHEVIVLAPTIENPPFMHAGTLVPVPSVPAPGRKEYRVSLGLTASLRERLAEFRPTLVHIATPDVLGFQAQTWALAAQVPIVCSYHTHFTSYLQYYHLSALEDATWRLLQSFYNSCLHTYTPTKEIASELSAHGVTSSLRIWPRGVDYRAFTPAHRCPEWRRELGISPDEPVVLLVCRLVWEKALDVYADVIRGLRASGLRHKSVIVGNGPALAGLQDLLPDSIFLGSLQGAQLARAYASADIYFFPSQTETFGMTTLEAMGSGLPTVVTNSTGSGSIVIHGETGFLAEPNDRVALLAYTQRLVEDAALRKRMGEAGVKRAREVYQWGNALSRLVGYYGEISATE
mmetsp:Transcript_27116/g.88949  ORF Transcript_27116/g.88949 Transcript_27116/m.88949 type:complete len:507 (+) Transcript_27116:194-1714(+)